jgi:hypothetical protein
LKNNPLQSLYTAREKLYATKWCRNRVEQKKKKKIISVSHFNTSSRKFYTFLLLKSAMRENDRERRVKNRELLKYNPMIISSDIFI